MKSIGNSELAIGVALLLSLIPIIPIENSPYLVVQIVDKNKEPIAHAQVSRNFRTYCGSNDSETTFTDSKGIAEIKEYSQTVSIFCIAYEWVFSPGIAGEPFYNYSHIHMSKNNYKAETMRFEKSGFILDREIDLAVRTGQHVVMRQGGKLFVVPLEDK